MGGLTRYLVRAVSNLGIESGRYLVGKQGSRFVSLGGTVNSQVLFVKSFGQPRVLAIFSLFSSIPPGVMISQVLFVKRFGQSELGHSSHVIKTSTQPT